MTTTDTAPLPLTKQQRRVKEYIRKYVRQHGYAPSWREIRDAFGFASLNAVTCHLKPLEAKGHIIWDSKIARSIRLLEVPHE